MLFQHATHYGKPRGPVLFMQTKVDWAMTMPAAAAPGHHLEICNLSPVLSADLSGAGENTILIWCVSGQGSLSNTHMGNGKIILFRCSKSR